MGDLVTVITPVAPYHKDAVRAAEASVEASTFPAKWLPVWDDKKAGPGWARNAGVRAATTPYIFFLDADDTLQPGGILHAVERHEKGSYTYGDWIHHKKGVQFMPDCYEWDTKSHVVSALMHRNTFQNIGGFNESVDFEDTEFYLRAMSKRICGVRSPYPLIAYNPDGERSVEALSDPDRVRYLIELRRRYFGMSCCGETSPAGPANEPQAGDILVAAEWSGNKSTLSTVDGREYPRTGNGKQLYVSAHDAAVGFLNSAGGQVPIKRVYVAPTEPDADFDALKRRLAELRS